jgi:hypothetical protein
MAKLVEVAQGKLGGALLIEDDICNAFNFAVTSDGHSRKDSDALFERGIDKNEAFNGAIHEEARILFDEIGFATMTCGEIEVTFLNEMFFDAAEDLHGIAVAEFGHEDTDCKRLAFAQRAREEAGAVVEFGGSFSNAVTGFLGDGADAGSIIQHE